MTIKFEWNTAKIMLNRKHRKIKAAGKRSRKLTENATFQIKILRQNHHYNPHLRNNQPTLTFALSLVCLLQASWAKNKT